jgi:hypothetical protein
MKLKLLYTGCLLLCMSTIASSNECLRYCHHTAGKIAIPEVSTVIPGKHTAEATEETDSEGAQNTAPTLIKLLYI